MSRMEKHVGTIEMVDPQPETLDNYLKSLYSVKNGGKYIQIGRWG